ncbi:hypothetical protein GCM10010172_84460 [Paractinoplanes ferrugineus]|uniref:Knr4/Smi1-like domain-containing protein n=1 Tax=Paractinoplanes ferrugineus TaxID=113564 RepID=A0A919IZJ6_9ACTN|nr:hypothetical protein [Actinoplanes ferrugineus]GIE10767.1 hypothetical protein Afe05nite_26070 [Actinoplanes ferrugineus]
MTLTVDDLNGYVERGLDADLARLLPDRPFITDVDLAEVRPIEPFLERLPPAAAASLAAFDRKIGDGTLREFLDIADWSYGFDFAANECGILDSDYETEVPEEDLYSIGADGGGNLYVMLVSGQIAVWFHEEEVLEEHTRWDNLDVFLWSYVRYEAVREGTLTVADIEADFVSLGQPGALEPELGLLTYLRKR